MTELSPQANDRCATVADQVVPEYRNRIRSYSCGGHTAKRWSAAFNGARVALDDKIGEAARIAEVLADDCGFWRPCSGCQESVDGCVSATDYPYDDRFRCQPGGGCRECGGIGVIWDTTDYEDMARFMLGEIDADPGTGQVAEVGAACENCGKPVMVGQLLLSWDDVGEMHADCEHPWSLKYQPGADEPEPCVLLGAPMLLVPLSKIAAAA